MNPFQSPYRRLALIGVGPLAGLLTAVVLHLPAVAAAVVDAQTPVLVERTPTPEERREGRCRALRAEQSSPELAQLARRIADREGCE